MIETTFGELSVGDSFKHGQYSYVKLSKYYASSAEVLEQWVRIDANTKVEKIMPRRCSEEIIAYSNEKVWPRSCQICGLGECTKKKEYMNFNIITKASINTQTINQILKDAIEKETGRKVKSMSFKITKQYDMRNEVSGEAVSGLDVEFV